MLPLQLNPQIDLAHRDDTLCDALLQDVPIGILVMEAPSEIRFVNQAALDLLGLSESQLLGQTPVDPEWHIIQQNGKPFQLKLQSVPVRAKHTLLLLFSRQPLRNLVLGVYRPTLGDSEALLRSADRPILSDPKFNIVTVKFLGLDVWALIASTFQPPINTNRLNGKRDGYLNRRTLVSITRSRRCQ